MTGLQLESKCTTPTNHPTAWHSCTNTVGNLSVQRSRGTPGWTGRMSPKLRNALGPWGQKGKKAQFSKRIRLQKYVKKC